MKLMGNTESLSLFRRFTGNTVDSITFFTNGLMPINRPNINRYQSYQSNLVTGVMLSGAGFLIVSFRPDESEGQHKI